MGYAVAYYIIANALDEAGSAYSKGFNSEMSPSTRINKQAISANKSNKAAEANTASPKTVAKNSAQSENPYNFVRTETPSGNPSSRTVGEYVKIIKEGGTVPPIEVAEVNSKLYVINGHHLLEAAKITNTESLYRILSKQEWQLFGYKTYSVSLRGAEASGQNVKLNKTIIKKTSE